MSIRKHGRTNWRDQAAGLLELPKDLLLDLPRITLTGSLQLSVENHRGLQLYSEQEIVIRAGQNLLIRVKGQDLQLGVVYDEEITVVGQIESVSFQQ